MPAHQFDLTFRVLVSKEDDQYLAHALELDLVGAGGSLEEAHKELTEMILCQLTFAAQMEDQTLLPHPAPERYFELWEKAQQTAVKAALRGAARTKEVRTKRATSIEISSQQVRAATRRQFKPGLACA